MDYLEHVDLHRASSWDSFISETTEKRKILLSTKATQSHVNFKYQKGDILLLGRESAGVPVAVHQAVQHRIVIPMQRGMRSLNVAISAGIVAGEALRQLGQFD